MRQSGNQALMIVPEQHLEEQHCSRCIALGAVSAVERNIERIAELA